MEQKKTTQTIQDKVIKIGENYKKTYNVFFKYMFFIITVIISITITYFLIKNIDQTINSDDKRTDNRQAIMASKQNFEKQQKTEIRYPNIIKLIVGDRIYEENNKLISNNNLLSLQGIILPKHISLKNKLEIKPIEYFSSNNYDKTELEKIINVLILNKDIEFESVQKNQMAQISNSINDTFSLNCINYTKIYNEICNHYVNTFIEDFFFYDISKDYSGFKEITNKLKDQKSKICENINKYILYSKDTTINKNFFSMCGDDYVENIENNKSFIKINNELNKRYIEINTYKNKDLNYYKLLSAQQIIFKEFSNGKIPIDRITKYSDFLFNLVKSNLLEGFYLDEAYYFNNYYLVDQINKFDDYSDEEGKRKIYSILQSINNINQGSKLENTKGLKDLLTNKTLIKTTETTDMGIENTTGKIEILSKEIENADYLIINSKKIDGYKITIVGYLKITNNNKKDLINTNIELEYNGQTFIVRKILIPNIEKLNNIVNTFITKNEKSLSETYSYIKENLGFYGNEEQISTTVYSLDNLCKQIQLRLSGTNRDLTSCEKDKIIIGNSNIIYEFLQNNYIITKIKISNSEINQEINENFGWIKTNEENILDIIINIITYNEKVNIKTKYIDIETVEQIEKQIGPILDFAQSGNKLMFETNIKGIDFIINYNKEKRQIGPMYFKNTLINTRSLIIKNIDIALEDIDTMKKLKSNPLDYIKTMDKSAYFLYQIANN